MSKKFLYKTTVSTFKSQEGVEQTREVKELIQLESEPFYIVYTKYIKWIYGINSGKTLALLMKLLDIMEFDTGIIDISRSNRQLLIKELELSQSSLTQCINRLIEKEAIYKRVIINQETGEETELKGSYMINPLMFWKGSLKSRKALKVQFSTIEEQAIDNEGDEYEVINMDSSDEEDGNS